MHIIQCLLFFKVQVPTLCFQLWHTPKLVLEDLGNAFAHGTVLTDAVCQAGCRRTAKQVSSHLL